MHDIHSFFQSINFVPETNNFDEIEIEKVVLNKKEEGSSTNKSTLDELLNQVS